MNNTLSSLPLDEIAKLVPWQHTEELKALAKDHAFASKPYLYPQLLAHISTWKPLKGPNGLYNLDLTVRSGIKTTLDRAVWVLSLVPARFVERQSSGDGLYYCRLVPLIMAAFKKYHNIKYSEWDRESVTAICVDKPLLEAMLEEVPLYPAEQIMEWRELALTEVSGKRKHPLTTFRINGTNLPKVYNGEKGPRDLSQLGRLMLLQIWCANPQTRNEYMILDPLDWDHIPDPLVVDQIFVAEEKPQPKKKSRAPQVLPIDLPWL